MSVYADSCIVSICVIADACELLIYTTPRLDHWLVLYLAVISLAQIHFWLRSTTTGQQKLLANDFHRLPTVITVFVFCFNLSCHCYADMLCVCVSVVAFVRLASII